MKTTLNIDDSVMQRLRGEAARRGTTMSALVKAGLRRVLAAPETARQPNDLPVLPSWHGGEELVDISDRDALYQAMEEQESAMSKSRSNSSRVQSGVTGGDLRGPRFAVDFNGVTVDRRGLNPAVSEIKVRPEPPKPIATNQTTPKQPSRD